MATCFSYQVIVFQLTLGPFQLHEVKIICRRCWTSAKVVTFTNLHILRKVHGKK